MCSKIRIFKHDNNLLWILHSGPNREHLSYIFDEKEFHYNTDAEKYEYQRVDRHYKYDTITWSLHTQKARHYKVVSSNDAEESLFIDRSDFTCRVIRTIHLERRAVRLRIQIWSVLPTKRATRSEKVFSARVASQWVRGPGDTIGSRESSPDNEIHRSTTFR